MAEEKIILTKIKNKKTKFFISTLGGFIVIILFSWYYNITQRYRGGFRRLSDESMERIRYLAPYFYFFVFLLLAIYFTKYYVEFVSPAIKDLKSGNKEVFYFLPEKYQTPFFEEYFIVTPIQKKQRIKITKEMFNAIHSGSTASISYAKHSKFVFAINVDGIKISFNETNDSLDD